MKLFSINAGTFKLDGGAMFGVVPKTLWHKQYPADENNRCTWIMRCLLVVTENRRILIDCGIGDKQTEKFKGLYEVTGNNLLYENLAAVGFSCDDITDVIFSHFHFDHCGGAVRFNKDLSVLELAFKNALFWTSSQQWNLATNPNRREKASFLKENFMPLYESGRMKFIDNDTELYPDFHVRLFFGHTDGQIISFIKYKEKTIVYMADFIPAAVHLPLPYIISYDTRPLISLEEKEKFLPEAVKNDYVLFFEHDYYNECCSLTQTEKGIYPQKYFTLKEYLNSASLK